VQQTGETWAAESLLRQIDEATRDVARARDERATDRARQARIRLAAIHARKRLVQRVRETQVADRRSARSAGTTSDPKTYA